MNRFLEFWRLVWIRMVVSKRLFIDFMMTASTYYGNLRFAKIDLSLVSLYFWRNPFRVARQYLQSSGSKGNDLYTYGETPLTTLQLICKRAGVTKDDTVLELGCGRGRTCFWLREWLGCKVIGIEQVPEFIKKANEIKERFNVDELDFVEGDYQTLDWGTPSVIYLYASNLGETEIRKLAEKIKTLPRGVKVVSVSFPIPGMVILSRFHVPFTWGCADVYVQV